MPEEVLSARALCSIDDVRSRIPGVTDRNTTIEPLIVREINAESGRIHRRARREFMPRAENPQTRRFDLTAYDQAERSAPIGDLADTSGLVVTIEDQTGATLETIASANYVLLPRDGDREPTEPYAEIWFPPASPAPATYLVAGNVLKLVGDFGFPAIPDELRDECANNCAAKIMRRLPATAQADEDSAQQQLRVSYRVTDSNRAPRG
jgi:hypothetical protein